ncbi:MAG: dephospho-CoA kinase [Firmicutes bacterium]|nr:dephospho-CoA kinase [Bacillota bacterium]
MVIGICGKFGSGKSYIAKQISEQTGFEIFNLDKLIIKKLMRPHIRWIAQKRLGTKLSLEHTHLLSNLGKMNKKLLGIEKRMILSWGNKKLKKLVKSDKIYLVDFFGLPISKHFKNFKAKVLVQSPEEQRIERFMTRNNFTKEQVANMDAIQQDIVDFDKYNFDFTIWNEYKTTPTLPTELLKFY